MTIARAYVAWMEVVKNRMSEERLRKDEKEKVLADDHRERTDS